MAEGRWTRLKIRRGAWLGVDVGSSRGKVLCFCVVSSDGPRALRVTFERGAARGPWPANDAARFLDLGRPTWTSREVERGVVEILDRSTLVTRWTAAARSVGARRGAGAAIDAPCGFASAEHTRRETERYASKSFDTCSQSRFEADLRRFASAANETPLRQRFFWKLVGLAAYRGLLGRIVQLAGDDGPSHEAITAYSARGLERASARSQTLPVPEAGFVTLREAFPSDTYARASGLRGELHRRSLALLRALIAAPWEFCGNETNGASSMPTPSMQQRLLLHRAKLDEQLARGQPLSAMRKISGDPSWADLWDAFACAFAAACEGHGAAVCLGLDAERLRVEGAVVAPACSRA